MATESIWVRRGWSLEWRDALFSQTLELPLAGKYHLRKVLVHATACFGFATHAAPSVATWMPYVQYTVDWYPAGGDHRQIFRGKYRVPGEITTYRPSGGSTDAFYSAFQAHDREIGINQRYNHAQDGSFNEGIVNFNFSLINGYNSSDPFNGFFEGTVSILGQTK